MSLVIRYGRPEDFAAALAVQKKAYAEKEAPLYGPDLPPLSETPETMAQEIAEGKKLVVGVLDGQVVASLRCQEREDGSIYFGRLSVDPACQGQGIGTRMAQAVETLYPDASSYVLDCGEKSAENFHIYSKLGYRKTGAGHQVPCGPYCFEMVKQRATVT